MANDKYKISIALCSYNGADFIAQQIGSFSAQTRLPDELIVCDDGSSDATTEIVRKFATDAPFLVRLEVNQKNLGSTKNFEKAIALCTGDLIFLSDQDDVWLPGKIERMTDEFERDSATALVFSDAELVDENLEALGCSLWDFTFPSEQQKNARAGNMSNVLLNQNVVTGATMAFRAEYREKFFPIPDDVPNLIHDAWIALVIADLAKVEFIDEPLIKYRQHSSQQLGLNLQSKKKRRSDAERKASFNDSIEFLRNEKLRLARTREFVNVLSRVAADAGNIEKLICEKQQRIEHYEARKNLPYNRAKRLLPITREIFSGRYHLFSKGFLSAAKDLFEQW